MLQKDSAKLIFSVLVRLRIAICILIRTSQGFLPRNLISFSIELKLAFFFLFEHLVSPTICYNGLDEETNSNRVRSQGQQKSSIKYLLMASFYRNYQKIKTYTIEDIGCFRSCNKQFKNNLNHLRMSMNQKKIKKYG